MSNIFKAFHNKIYARKEIGKPQQGHHGAHEDESKSCKNNLTPDLDRMFLALAKFVALPISFEQTG